MSRSQLSHNLLVQHNDPLNLNGGSEIHIDMGNHVRRILRHRVCLETDERVANKEQTLRIN